MSNYEILKEYEEHKEPVPSYMEWCQQKELEKANDYLINILMTQNTELKNLLKEIRGKIHYINTPKNQHNVFGNSIKEKINKILNDNS